MNGEGLRAIDGLQLPVEYRDLLRPAEPRSDEQGNVHHLPRFFFEVPSWPEARAFRLTSHFTLAELMMVDCREADLLLGKFPHYVPCAIAVLARYLEASRTEAGAPVFVSANGGYRSPAHRFSATSNLHHWGTAANVYRIGDTYLDDETSIAKYSAMADSLGTQVFVRPYEEGDDHLHFDIGFVMVTPRDISQATP